MDKIIYFLIGLVIGLFVVFKPVERLSPPKDIKDNLEQIDSLKRLNSTDSLKAELIKREVLTEKDIRLVNSTLTDVPEAYKEIAISL